MRNNIFTMRIAKNKMKVHKLCEHFSLLDEQDQEHVFEILQSLLYVKLKADGVSSCSGNGALRVKQDNGVGSRFR